MPSDPHSIDPTLDLPAAVPPTLDLPAAAEAHTVDLPAASTVDGAVSHDSPAAAPVPPKPRHAPGRVGRFELNQLLGEGAFGEVYRAFDPVLDRDVALKVAKPAAVDTAEKVARFRREAKSAAGLRHPNIVPVYESGQDGSRFYIASGFVEGRTLRDEVEASDGKPLELGRAAELVRKLAEALAYAHSKGVVHRDVKPENVLVQSDGEPVLTDFGLAARAGDGEVANAVAEEQPGSAPLVTQDGRVLGTPAYMSPEQAAGRSSEATAAADQYALGVMLYEFATGRRPFEGPIAGVLVGHTHIPPKAPRGLNPRLPRDLEAVILRCLEKKPEARYRSCSDLADDLRRWRAGEPVTARPVGRAERLRKWATRNPILAGAVGTATALLVIGSVTATLLAAWALGEKGRADIATGVALENEKKTNEALKDLQREKVKTDNALAAVTTEQEKTDKALKEKTIEEQLKGQQLLNVQLMRVAGIYEREPSKAFELLHDVDACPIVLRDAAWRYYESCCTRWQIATFTVSPFPKILPLFELK